MNEARPRNFWPDSPCAISQNFGVKELLNSLFWTLFQVFFLFWQSDPSWPDISWNCLDAVKWNQSDFWTDKNFLSNRNRVFLTIVNNEDFTILILKINEWFGQSSQHILFLLRTVFKLTLAFWLAHILDHVKVTSDWEMAFELLKRNGHRTFILVVHNRGFWNSLKFNYD